MLGLLLGDNTILESFFNTQGLTSPVLLCECSIGTVCLAGNPIPTGMCTAPNLIFNLWAPSGNFFPASYMQQCHQVAAQPIHICIIPRNPTKLLFKIK